MDEKTLKHSSKRYTMILVVSTFSSNSSFRTYNPYKNRDPLNCLKSPKGTPVIITSTQTNETAVKYAIARLFKEEKRLERVICLCSKEAMEKSTLVVNGEVGRIPYEFLKTQIEKFCNEYDYDMPAIEPLKSRNDLANELDIGKASSSEIINSTIDQLGPLDRDVDRVILDTTGGWRTTSLLLTLLTRFLRMKGVSLEFSIYSKILPATENQAHEVHDTYDTDRLYDYIEAATVFKKTGNPEALDVLTKENAVKEIRDLIDAMKAFYNDFSLSRIDKLDDNLKYVHSAASKLIDFKKSHSPAEFCLDTSIFISLISQLLQENLPLFTFSDLPENPCPDYPALIKWCCDNDQLLRALTLYTDKYPEFLFKKKFVEYTGSKNKRNGKSDKYLFMQLISQTAEKQSSSLVANTTLFFRDIAPWKKDDQLAGYLKSYIPEDRLENIIYDFIFLNKIRNDVVHVLGKYKLFLTGAHTRDFYNVLYSDVIKDCEIITAAEVKKVLLKAVSRPLS